jgi:acyl-CoA dehydrogenase
MREILEDNISRLLGDNVTPKLLRDAEAGNWCGDLWELIASHGISHAMVSEVHGGSGLSWPDAYPLIAVSGKRALPLPLPETILAAWLLDQSGLEVPEGAITIADPAPSVESVALDAPLRADRSTGTWRLTGRLAHVPWARFAHYCVSEVSSADGPQIALFELASLGKQCDLNMAREPRDSVILEDHAATAVGRLPATFPPRPLRFYGAMLRSAQAAGAIEALVENSVKYASERVQFGRPIAKFQAIQQQIAVLSCDSAASTASAQYAFHQAGSVREQMAIAAAKVRVSEAIGRTASIAHAVHGAMGFTYEHVLHFSTRRLWSWRSEFGSDSWWSKVLGAAVCRRGRLWVTVTEGTEPLFPE